MSLSYSQLSVYRRCPKQYEFMAVKKIPRRISSGESFGSSIHHTLKRWGELEMLCQTKTPAKNQLKLFSDHEDDNIKNQPLEFPTLLSMFRECFIAEGYDHRAAMDDALLRGQSLLEKFFAWWRKRDRVVLSIESGFKLEIESEKPIILSGRFDRIEKVDQGLLIIDYKTGEAQTQERVDQDLQLSIYALAAAKEWGKPIAGLSLLFLNEDGVIERTTTRTQSQLKDAMATIRLLHEGIERKDFQGHPTKEKCSYCPYREICPAKAN